MCVPPSQHRQIHTHADIRQHIHTCVLLYGDVINAFVIWRNMKVGGEQENGATGSEYDSSHERPLTTGDLRRALGR